MIAITSGVGPSDEVLAAVWNELLPALGPDPLPIDATAAAALAEKLRSLSVAPPMSADPGGLGAGRTYRFAAKQLGIDTMCVTPAADGKADLLAITVAGNRRTALCGRDAWMEGAVHWTGGKPRPASAAGGWDDDTYTARICFVETPFVGTLRLAFAGDTVTLTGGMNIGFGPTALPELVGTASPVP